MKAIVWYDRSIRLWTAIYVDENEFQVGNAGYGTSKAEALSDVEYQSKI